MFAGNTAISKAIGSAVPVSALADNLSQGIRAKIEKLYPLRGKILSSDNNETKLNIGRLAGVSVGGKFTVVDDEAVLEVVSIDAEESITKVIEGDPSLIEGMRVQAY